MPATRTILIRVSSALLAAGALVVTGGLSPAVSASSGRPAACDLFACGQGPGGLKMTMQSDQEMAQACAEAGAVAGAYAAAPQPAGAERAVSVQVDGAGWACVQKREVDQAYVECSHEGETLSLSEFQPLG
ncbi:hypothetical protein E1292_15385 [Nonomuraea deserti]|uniref:Uncharacterized protein n=1 Tax=Nonomuraea deserti TaxID=1848322 RepID=A0A4R4VV20_9ACTN|nr:hypothetical protein [Nonomuraea deserti]TDD06275.1 hypothetical protein E1292_15385 [Nonomuraea deserti]